MPSYVRDDRLDAIIIGAGFGGCYLLHNLRKQGFKVRAFEKVQGLGGVWWHNRYPGARSDTPIPHYEFSDPEIWKNWEWSEEYSGQPEIARYFEFVDKNWDLSKDITFGIRVTERLSIRQRMNGLFGLTRGWWLRHDSSSRLWDSPRSYTSLVSTD